jgi:AcrR family transcriptional regulator
MLNDVPEPVDTKRRILDAAIDTLREDGFAVASARTIARRGDFNQALIFYHYGTLNGLVLAAFDEVTRARIERYVEVFEGPEYLATKLLAMRELYRDDRESGRLRVITEVIGGANLRPDLAPEVAARIDPWLDMTDGVVGDIIAKVGLAGVVEPRDAAFAISACFLGMDLLGNLGYDEARPERLMEIAATLAPMLELLTGGFGAPS